MDFTAQVIAFLITLGAVLYSVLTAGRSTQAFNLDTFSRTLFHSTLGVGSCHASMLFIGWSLRTDFESWELDRGEVSVWIKAATQWTAAALYVWSLLAPFACPERFTSDDHPQLRVT